MPDRLRQELKKRDPFDSIEQEATLSLVRTADQLENRFGRLFREFGLTSSQYNVLRILRGEGAPLPSLEIASRLLCVAPAITGLINRLEDQGMVKRRRCEQDGRVVYVEITKPGLAVLGRLDKPLLALHKCAMSPLSNTEQKQLIALLEKCRQSSALTGDAPSGAP
ncbi:HTH-type transcriptional regulator MgrA [Posidoniimonas polymericola]|uniref:HTH-type transcriptional regulator MgrA n=1 Tax=Posidoniimonas polymericola TaxID=2528002 RepID=A0A5C5YLV4_9BACT|nr:MarR family transcriptional regulator [Posidoniimonas polymericola]TWT75941.1 HTH-type transcriptional regulator MgrA [Posidoniimonas polymericola]